MEAKRGRKAKHFIDPRTNAPVVGLTRRPDGRWRIIGTHITFREIDPIKAIERFHKLTAKDDPTKRLSPRPYHYENMWDYFAQQIIERPQWVAKRVNCERIGWVDAPPPETPPTFEEIETVWEDHFDKSAEQKRRVLACWRDFKTTTEIVGVNDITPLLAIRYRDDVYSRGFTPKMQSNIFTRIRRLFTFAREREIAPRLLSTVINSLGRLKPNDSTVSIDPHPIERDDFHKLLKVANPADRAMVLLMLNGAYYTTEVVRLKWTMIKDGAIITHRAKEGKVVRACVLWPETIEALEALEALPKTIEYIFVAYTGLPLGNKGADLRFRQLRDAAGVKDTSSSLRDGAATAMAMAGVSEKHIAVVLGHRSGISDHYIKRNPSMIADACLSIRKAYFD